MTVYQGTSFTPELTAAGYALFRAGVKVSAGTCDDLERGVFRVSALGSAALGQLAADITGSPHANAVARLVFEPLGMTGSSFPSSWPRDSAVVGYTVPACRAA